MVGSRYLGSWALKKRGIIWKAKFFSSIELSIELILQNFKLVVLDVYSFEDLYL